MDNKKLSISEMCQIGSFVAIIIVCAQISIPMPYGVPMTLQTFAILLAGMVLGPKKGTIAALVYVLLGAIGVPVFTAFAGGLGIIFGRTGGFILAFPFVALAAGIGGRRKNIFWLILWLVIGTIILFIGGMLMFSFVTSSSLMVSFTLVVVPFIPTEIIKIVMVIVLGKVIKKALNRSGII